VPRRAPCWRRCVPPRVSRAEPAACATPSTAYHRRPARDAPAPPRVDRPTRPSVTSTSGTLLTTFLDALLDGARARVAEASAREPLDALRERASGVPTGPSLYDALAGEDVAVIAEVKRASPSKGDLAPAMDARLQASEYLAGGAAAVSVLTEPERFKGSLADLADVAGLGGPTLRKDFLVDPYQVWEARATGAAAVLLIVAALDEPTLALLHDEARAAGLDVLVEVHDASEAEAAARLDARIIGVNARDLRTFELDRDAFARLAPTLPEGALAVAESGVAGPDDVRRVVAEGADAVLVGESLVRATDPRAAVAALVAAGRMSSDEPDAAPSVPPDEHVRPL
jgi:indole-3-glycerol phosphate synthase